KPASLEEFQQGLNLAAAQNNDDARMVMIRTIGSEIGVKKAIELIGNRPEPRWKLIKAYLYQSDQDYTNAVAMVDEAMADFDKMTPQEKDQTLRVAGTVYLTVRPARVDKAKDAYVKLLANTPDDMQSLNNLACLLIDQ